MAPLARPCGRSDFWDRPARSLPEPRPSESAFVYGPGLGGLEEVLGAVSKTELKIYLDWATWDLRNPHENWDTGAANRRIFDALRSRGFALSGGEVADGLGWANWRQRTDALLEALFPR